ncbi:MAG: fatty acid desaturase [Bacteriovoracaceae bacterium]
MNQDWTKFILNQYFLLRYSLAHTVVLSLISWVIFKNHHYSSSLVFKLEYFLFLPFSILIGIQVPVLMHNCMHANFKSPLTNFILGELSGFFALMSLGILRINHMLHHAYSDTDHDPHNPSKKSFIIFFFISQFTGIEIVQEKYFEFHGKDFKRQLIFKFNIVLHFIGHVLRLLVWFLILGPNLFVFFYLPAFLVYSLAFAHVNYITHSIDKKGNVEILNKNDNLYYKFINLVGSGVYFHKNHHLSPRLINPMHFKRKENT